MKKIILFSLVVVFMLSGCVRLFYPYTKTPKINKIDMALEMDEDNYYYVARKENTIYPKKTEFSFKSSEENIKEYNDKQGNLLSTVYEHTTLKKVKQEFNNIQAPCEDLAFNKIKCIYNLIFWPDVYNNRHDASFSEYAKITLTFTRENNKTTVEYKDIGCDRYKEHAGGRCDSKVHKGIITYKNSTLPAEIEEYFTKIDTNKSKE